MDITAIAPKINKYIEAMQKDGKDFTFVGVDYTYPGLNHTYLEMKFKGKWMDGLTAKTILDYLLGKKWGNNCPMQKGV